MTNDHMECTFLMSLAYFAKPNCKKLLFFYLVSLPYCNHTLKLMTMRSESRECVKAVLYVTQTDKNSRAIPWCPSFQLATEWP